MPASQAALDDPAPQGVLLAAWLRRLADQAEAGHLFLLDVRPSRDGCGLLVRYHSPEGIQNPCTQPKMTRRLQRIG